MVKEKLSTQPYRGARDFYPEDMKIQNYIFDTWRRVCRLYGFEEYNFPILEPFEIFAAKTGEEIVNQQLYSFVDQGDRKLAIRPELTPGTVRMIAARYNSLPKPLKWFMIGNNWRYERPQKGRGREFNQMEVNIFGVDDVTADFEIFQIIISLMEAFGANEDQFEILVSDRRLINELLQNTLQLNDTQSKKIRTIMDNYSKLTLEEFSARLSKESLDEAQIQTVIKFMNTKTLSELSDLLSEEKLNANMGYKALLRLFDMLEKANLLKFCRFDPSIIRGFDYSDGIVYEVFDKNPNNKRSLFGGERFDKLINIFGEYDLAATGFAIGDWTLVEFLRNWNLLPSEDSYTKVLVTTWPTNDQNEAKFLQRSLEISKVLRDAQINTETWIETNSKLEKQLKYANNKNIKFVVIVGENELKSNEVVLKNMETSKQEICSLEVLPDKIQ